MIEVNIDDSQIRRALQQLQHAASDISPALREIREVTVESTKRRFETGTGPDGEHWPLNSVLSTLLLDPEYGGKRGDKPLIDFGTLMDEIHGQLIGNNTLEVGSTMEYAAMMQFGGTKAEFPHLWGDIPARPFLGISDDDETEIMRIICQHLESAI
jgi:phage virion morphogenesis protein